jgi:hypothetical protein
MSEKCTCGRLRIGLKLTENRNWHYDCPEHGVKSVWYRSDEQRKKRLEQQERTKWLQGLAAAKRQAPDL